MKWLYIHFAFILYASLNAYITVNAHDAIEELIAEIYINNTEDANYDEVYNDLYTLIHHPVNLNTANTLELEKLHVLTDFQIHALLSYRNKHKKIYSIYELNYVYGFDKVLVQLIEPFISIQDEKTYFKEFNLKKAYKQSEMIIRAQIKNTCQYTAPKGNRFKYYGRFKSIIDKRLKTGLTLEKDPGEEFLTGSNKHGFDFYSGYLMYTGINNQKQFILGDYVLTYGQGLSLWNSRTMNKTASTCNIRKRGKGISGYTSTDENRFFRGIANRIKIHETIEFSSFFSCKKIDANINETDTTNNQYKVKSFPNTGVHVSPNEIQNEKKIYELATGGNFCFRQKQFETSLTGYYLKYYCDIIQPPEVYKKFEVTENKQLNVSFDFQWVTNKFILFGENAIYNFNHLGSLTGIMLNLPYSIELSVLYRYYDKGFINMLGNGFSENTRDNNEKGIYTGINIPLFNNLTIAAYTDHFYFPWLKFRTDAPSSGREDLLKIQYLFSEDIKAYIQLKHEINQSNTSVSDHKMKTIINGKKYKFRCNVLFKINNKFKLQNRLELTAHSNNSEYNGKGMLVLQDFQYTFEKIPLKTYFRYMIFDTDDYDSRIYTYENDLLYTFSVPAFHTKGMRFYNMIKVTLFRQFRIWCKYSLTIFENARILYLENNNQSKHEIKFQLQYKF